ncbi:hypothetical protein EC973_006618 [Apophysomyces ossiformis]|uniref:TPR-like protein n=1 Tax=Apophysomyces ossiformis TaxID=679940 RepID=A0A8H7EQY2_9FUNG|nr:hypothetical protein EC973_006618 [Apophysomyces ossiformis]
MADWERAMASYESALRHNPYSINALSNIASLCRGREQFAKAVEYFKRILAIQENNGDTWSALGHCYLMMDNLQDAYHAYQQALYHLPNPKDPKLWYGIGILYDRYGSIEHAEEAFSAVMKMDPNFEKANEIYFRLGIIYKQQQKYDQSLQCFRYILHNPPRPLTEVDIWFQTGHVYEQQKEYEHAKEAYERVLAENPDHAKVLQQLGWLYHQQNASFSNQAMAIQYLTQSLKADSNDAQSWYLLGRCYMAEQNYNKAYEAYQQAVYRDARNPTFWCSIGVLYYQINQYRDALDAYSRAIRLNPYISEVWYDLGTLYESCNNQIQDALDAYQRASELDPNNPHIRQRLDLLRRTHGIASSTPTTTGPVSTPVPQDVNNPYQYQNGPPPPSSMSAPYPPPPMTSGPQGPPPGMAQYPSVTSRAYDNPPRRGAPPLMEHGPPRDLPMPPQNERRSPVPYHQPQNPRDDVRIPDIGGGRAPTPSERVQMKPMMGDHDRSLPPTPHPPGPSMRPPINKLQAGGGVRSPIPSHLGSPNGKPAPMSARPPSRNSNHSGPSPRITPSYYNSPRAQHPAPVYRPAPPLPREHSPQDDQRRRPSAMLYEPTKREEHRPYHPAEIVTSEEKRSPANKNEEHDNESAADTLISMQKGGFAKRTLEMADEDDDAPEKRPKLRSPSPKKDVRTIVDYESSTGTPTSQKSAESPSSPAKQQQQQQPTLNLKQSDTTAATS